MFIRMKNKWSDEFEGSEIIKEVYQIYDEKNGDDIDLWAFNFEGFPYCITKDMIIAQADTIEKLCDEFVIIGSGKLQRYKKPTLEKAIQKKQWLNKLGYKAEVYGSIWVDDNLIKVAKINEKGVLELL